MEVLKRRVRPSRCARVLSRRKRRDDARQNARYEMTNRMSSRGSCSACSLCAWRPSRTPAVAQSSDDGWTVPRTADGHPDLQGVWASDSATPLERPEELADTPFLTDEEVATLAAAGRRRSSMARPTPRSARACSAPRWPTGPIYQSGDGVTAENPRRHRQLQPLLADRSLVRQPHGAHRGPAGRPDSGADGGGQTAGRSPRRRRAPALSRPGRRTWAPACAVPADGCR